MRPTDGPDVRRLSSRRQTSQYVDVYRVREGKLTEHWHLPIDQTAESELFAG